ncbi:MAG: 30S ribosomal protein S20 [Bryobacteraceae bacterium]
MANTVSALKRGRMTERRTAINRRRKSRLRLEVRKMRRLLAAKDVDGATGALSEMYSLADRAAKWGIIKRNTAARYKSRLTLRLRGLTETQTAA